MKSRKPTQKRRLAANDEQVIELSCSDDETDKSLSSIQPNKKMKMAPKKRALTPDEVDKMRLATYTATVKQKNEDNRRLFEELQLKGETLPSQNIYEVKYGNHTVKVIELVNLPFGELPTPHLRNVDPPTIDPETDDVEFQLMDVQIGRRTDYNKDEKKDKTTVYLSGTTAEGLSVVVFIDEYYPYFYMSIPHAYYSKEEDFITELQTQFRIIRRDGNWRLPVPHDMTIVHRMPTTGYRPKDDPMKFVKFEFNTVQDMNFLKKELLRMYPVTTKEDILEGRWEKRNETVICEDSEEEIKFLNTYKLVSGGWVKLQAGEYEPINDNLHNAFYGFSASKIYPIKRDKYSNFLIDVVDVEQENHTEDENRFPEADDPLDHVLSVAHTIRDFHKKYPRFSCVFIWGNQEIKILPEHVKELSLKENLTLFVFRYHDAKSMMVSWSKWWSQQKVSTDMIIGHNIFGYDLRTLASRLISEKVYGNELEPEEKVWGRLAFFPLKMRKIQIQSKAIDFSEYTVTPSFGRIFMDTLIMYKRDVTLKLQSYKLDALLTHILKIKKVNLHHSLIKTSFYGTPEDRGKLTVYNFGDVLGCFALAEKSTHVLKFFQMTQVNLVPPNMICTRGQSIKVYGGFHNNAMRDGYVVYRPYYHPLLDNPVFDDMAKMINRADTSESGGDFKDMRYCADSQEFKAFDINDFYKNVVTTEVESLDVELEEWEKEARVTSPSASAKEKEKISTQAQKRKDEAARQLRIEKESNDVLKVKVDTSNLLNSIYNKTIGIDSQAQIDSIADGLVGNITMYGYRKHTVISKKARSDVAKEKETAKSSNSLSFGGRPINEIIEYAKNKKQKTTKGFSGGFVMEPRVGLASNIAILDWNSLYPNIMHNYKQDPSLLVLDAKYANLPHVHYNDIRFNEHMVFRYATKENGVVLRGVLIKHTWNLVCTRKVVQGFQGMYETLRDEVVNMYRETLNKLGDWGYNKDADLDTQLDAQTDKIASRKDLPTDESGDHHNLADFYAAWFAKQLTCAEKILGASVERVDASLTDQLEQLVALSEQYAAQKDKIDAELFTKNSELVSTLIEMLKETLVLYDAEARVAPTAPLSTPYIGKALLQALAGTLGELRTQAKNANSKQNELKTGSNSTFGFAGAGGIPVFHETTGAIMHGGKHQTLPISACITFIGRFCINTCREYLENKYGYEVIYIDTDSLFIDMHLPDTEEAFKGAFSTAARICQELSDMHPGTMTIKIEKVAKKALFIGPKMYVLFKFEKPDDPDGKIDIKGLQITKRDYCDFLRKNGVELVQIILRKGDIDAGLAFITDKISDLIDGKVDKTQLKLFKKITKGDYGEDTMIGHVKLAQRIELRHPGQGPKSGECVEYAYINVGYDPKDKKKMYEKIEDFSYIVENNLPIDYIYYVTKHFKQPLNVILDKILSPERLAAFWNDVESRVTMKQLGVMTPETEIEYL